MLQFAIALILRIIGFDAARNPRVWKGTKADLMLTDISLEPNVTLKNVRREIGLIKVLVRK